MIESGAEGLMVACDHAVDAVVLGLPDGRVLGANPAACEMFGGTEEELCRAGRDGLADPSHPSWREALTERRRTGSVTALAPYTRLDKTPFLAEFSSAIFETLDGEERTISIVRGVSGRVRLERQLRAYDEIVEAFLAGADTGRALRLVVMHACHIFDAAFASISTPDDDGQVTVAAAHGDRASELTGQRHRRGSLQETVIRTMRPLLLHHMTEVAPDRVLPRLGPAMIVPIASGESAAGALLVGARPGTRPYGRTDLAMASQYASRVASVFALESTRSDTENRLRVLVDQLQTALDSRTIVEQAKGFTAARRGVGTEEAFELLRSYARSHSMNLHAVCRLVVQRRLWV